MKQLQIRRVVAALWGAVNIVMGLSLLLQGNSRTRNPTYITVRMDSRWLDPGRPMLPWGVLFLTVGLIITVGVFTDRRLCAVVGLIAGAMLSAFYFTDTGFSAVFDGGTFTGLALGLGVVGAQIIAVWRLDDTWGM